MRLALKLFVLAALVPSLVLGSAAFSKGSTGGRTITVDVVGDAAAYLAVVANPSSPHTCFAPEQTSPSTESGKLKIDFGSAASCAGGTGTGVNAGDSGGKRVRYAFHDLLKVTNKGTRTILVWVNATTTTTSSGQVIHVAKSATTGQMTDSDSLYSATSATPLTLTVGSSGYVGVRLKTGSLASGSIAGTVTFDAH